MSSGKMRQRQSDDPVPGAASGVIQADFGSQLQAGFLPPVGAFRRGASAEDLSAHAGQTLLARRLLRKPKEYEHQPPASNSI